MRYQEFAESQPCPECGGASFSDLMLAEKQDACYHKVKSRYKVWPSAYASGALVQCRKKGAANWGNKSKNESVEEARAATAAFRAGNKKRAELNAMSDEERRDYDREQQEKQRKRDDARLERERQKLAAKKGVAEAGNPQMVARRISVPRVSTVDTSAPWVQNQIQQARRRKKEFNELETDREKFDFLFKLKSGKTTNTIKIRKDNSTLNLNIEKYNPGTGDIELVGYSTSAGRKGSVEQRYRANTNTFDYQGRERKGLTGGFNYYFSPGTSLELMSSQPRVKTQAPAPAVSKKPVSPWDILDKKK